MPARLVDIARSLNLSISTVYAAMRDRADISSTTRKLVRAKACELGYRPDSVARSLVNRQTQNIGIVVPSGPVVLCGGGDRGRETNPRRRVHPVAM
jgi:DNA-binding LacI/PurR family transcriptional regulator